MKRKKNNTIQVNLILKTKHHINMKIELPKLPFDMNALEPYISQETLEYHYGKHHNTYVIKLNGLISGTKYEGENLETIIKTSNGGIFNNAAQIWNHSFYWNCLAPNAGGKPI